MDFRFEKPSNFDNSFTLIIAGDFNSHSPTWGYSETDQNGENVQEWAETELFYLIYHPKLLN